MGLFSSWISLPAALFAISYSLSLAEGKKIDWLSPTEAATYNHGETIPVTLSSSLDLASASFRLCNRRSDNADGGKKCGIALTPSMTHSGDKYVFSIPAPTVSSDSKYYLKMDVDGEITRSPSFILTPNAKGDHSPPQTILSARPLSQSTLRLPINTSRTAVLTSATSLLEAVETSQYLITSQLQMTSGLQTILQATSSFTRSSGSPSSLQASVLPTTVAQLVGTAPAYSPRVTTIIPLCVGVTALLGFLSLFIARRRSIIAQRARGANLLSIWGRNDCDCYDNSPTTKPPFLADGLDRKTSGDVEKALMTLSELRATNGFGTDLPVANGPHHSLPEHPSIGRGAKGGMLYDIPLDDNLSPSSQYSRPTPRDHLSRFIEENSTTGSILTRYLSSSRSSPAVVSRQSSICGDFPRPPPKSYTRPQVPSINLGGKWDLYDEVMLGYQHYKQCE